MLVRRIRNRGANIVVEAHAEVLFAATGDVGRWQNRLSHRVRAAAAAAAPRNKRPRWAHYGKPLKTTFTATSRYQEGNMRVYSAIGSSAPHAYYVDQGTGVFNGSGPYPAKVLPPWQRGEGSLYEATWRPGGPGKRLVAPVMIKGQKGQGFFAEGLARGFRSMRLRSFQLPGEGGPKIANAMAAIPTGMTDFKGNTPGGGAFIASLTEWREWRDEAWTRGSLGRKINPGRRPPTRLTRAQRTAQAEADRLREEREAAYQASVEAAERRRKEAERRVKEAAERREAGRKKREQEKREREERDRKLREANALRRGNEAMRRAAYDYLGKIQQIYPEADVTKATLADGVVVYRVTYYTSDGERHVQQWAYGYS
jgi:hypothetical protein